MKKLILEPDGFPCTLAEAAPGPFLSGDELCFKSEYRTDLGKIEAYCSSGEFFCGDALNIQPLRAVWVDEE